MIDNIGVTCSNGQKLGPVGGGGGNPFTVSERETGKGFKAVQFRTAALVDKIKFYDHLGNFMTEHGGNVGNESPMLSCDDKIMGIAVGAGSKLDRAMIFCGKLQ